MTTRRRPSALAPRTIDALRARLLGPPARERRPRPQGVRRVIVSVGKAVYVPQRAETMRPVVLECGHESFVGRTTCLNWTHCRASDGGALECTRWR